MKSTWQQIRSIAAAACLVPVIAALAWSQDRTTAGGAALGRMGATGAGVAPAASPSIALPLDLAALAELCEHAVTGEVVSVSAYESADGTKIYTDIQIAVETDFKGNVVADGVLALTELGGVVGDVEMVVTHAPRFNVGERVLLFTERTPDGRLIVLGRDLAKFTLRPAPGVELDERGEPVDTGEAVAEKGSVTYDDSAAGLVGEVGDLMAKRGYVPVKFLTDLPAGGEPSAFADAEYSDDFAPWLSAVTEAVDESIPKQHAVDRADDLRGRSLRSGALEGDDREEQPPEDDPGERDGQCLGGGCTNFNANYPSGTFSTTSPSWTTISTCIYGGEYAYYSVTSGNTYEWSQCTTDGGACSFDGQLSLWNQSGTTAYCYSDDYCGDDAKIRWTATFTGIVRVLVSKYNCQNQSTCTTLVWRCEVAQDHCYACGTYDYTIAPSSTYQTHSDAFGANGCRWYRMYLTRYTQYRFTVCEGGGGYTGDTVFELWNEACDSQVAYNDDYCSLGSQIDYVPTTTGYHYLKVRGYGNSAASYTLAYRYIPGSCTACPSYEYGPYTPASTYATHSGVVYRGGCRQYAFNLTAGHLYRFTFCEGGGTADYDTYLILRDASCSQVAVNDDSCGLLSQIDYTPSVSGTYLLEVNSCCIGGSGGTYTLAYIDFGAALGITSVSPDHAPAGVGSAGPSGSLVTVTGTGFGTKGANDHMVFWNYGTNYYYNDAYIVSWTDTQIQCYVPAGCSSKDCAVYKGGTWSNFYPFTVDWSFWYRWQDQLMMPVEYYINQNGCADISGDGAFTAARAGLQTWENVQNAYLDHSYRGTTTLTATSNDGYNVVSWTNSGWSHGSGVIAVSTVWLTGGYIVETDMECNDQDFAFTTAGIVAGQVDVQNLVTHEGGHGFCGLNDLYGTPDSEKTMFGTLDVANGESKKRTLEWQDIAGCEWIYGWTGPANDACANATQIASLPAYASGKTQLATSDYTASTCDGPYKNIWFRVLGTGNELTATTCSPNTTFDTEIAVFDACGGSQVACNDDYSCSWNGLHSTVRWCSVNGQPYYISVGSYYAGGSTGSFELYVYDDEITPANPTGASASPPSICSGESTQLTAAAAGACGGSVDIDGAGTGTWNYPFSTYYHDARTTSIYLASEFGCQGGTITAMSYYVSTVPGQTMNAFTIRMRHTAAASYANATFENDDWLTVYHANEPAGSTGWRTFTFATPFTWNGTDNLEVDVSFNNASYTTDGYVYYYNGGTNRTKFYRCDSCICGTIYPLTWTCTGALTTNVPRVIFTLDAATAAQIEWYSGSCGGTYVGTGSPLTVYPTTTTTYYARAYNPNSGCFSSGCAGTTVTVNQAPANDTCAGAIALTLGIPAAGDTTDACCHPETLGYCGTSDGTGGALWYKITGNGNRFTASTCNDANFDTKIRVYTDGCGTLTCVGGNDDFYGDPWCNGNTSWFQWCTEYGREYLILVHGFSSYEGTFNLTAYDESPVAPSSISVDHGSFCAGAYAQITLTANGGYGDQVRWYSGSCGGTDLGTGNPKTISAPGSTTTYYAARELTADGVICATSGCAEATVTVHPLPPNPTNAASNPATICAGDASNLTASVGGAEIDWYTGSCGGTFVATGNSIYVSPSSTTTYYARARTTAGCESTGCDSVTVTVEPDPPAPTNVAADPAVTCPGETSTLSASAGGADVDWYTGGCGVTYIGTGATLPVAPMATTTYYARARTAAGCESADCGWVTVTVDQAGPVFTYVPDPISVRADAGGCTASGIDLGQATATDTHHAVVSVVATRSDAQPLGAPYPPGVTTITWTATDACGHATIDSSQYVEVLAQNDLDVVIALRGMPAGSVTRCISFDLYDADCVVYAFSDEVTFTDGVSGNLSYAVPCGDYDCIVVQNALHTLARRLDRDAGLNIANRRYVAGFVGPNDDLVGGDLYDDDMIDIVDFGVYIAQWGATYGPVTCLTAPPHADINGDDAVGPGDFAFIQTNFLTIGDAACCGAFPVPEPRASITLEELKIRGLGHLAVADLNADGVIDLTDVQLFIGQ